MTKINTEETNTKEEDRREYFRLDETLLMGYVREEELEESDLNDDANFQFIQELSSMTQQFKAALGRMTLRSPDVTTCFKLLDAKLNLLAEGIYAQSAGASLQRRKINISGSGLNFSTVDKLSIGEILQLKLVLSPDLTALMTKAKVVNCVEQKTPSEQKQYDVSVKFTDLSDVSQDMIVRHVMQSQSNLLRKDKI